MHQHAAVTEYFGGIEQPQPHITHLRPTDIAALIGPVHSQSTTQPIIQVWNAGNKFDKLIMLDKRNRGSECHASSHGALINIVRFRRSDCTGASSRARYSA